MTARENKVDSHKNTGFFSVIVPTRNRQKLLERCLGHILEQTFTDFKVHVIDDGSPPEVYEAAVEYWEKERRVVFHRITGHVMGVGPAVARNYGLKHCNSEYVAFCDDDDYWTDERHLEIAWNTLQHLGRPDMYITNQVLINNNEKIREYWNINKLRETGIILKDCGGEFIQIEKSELLRLFPGSCAHVNITICKTEKLKAINGFWEEIRYAEDLDLYLRLIDSVNDKIIIRLKPVAVQEVSDKKHETSASKMNTELEQLFIAAFVMEHVLSVTAGSSVRAFALNYLSETCKHISEYYSRNGKRKLARLYARSSLNHKFSFKWFLYTIYLHLNILAK